VLGREGVVERFLNPGEDYTEEEIKELKESWMGMWGLDVYPPLTHSNSSPNEDSSFDFSKLVLKPQREGGGNNVYKSDIPAFLERLPKEERAAWIVMEMIETPREVGGYLVRSGAGGELVRAEVVSELGVFGWALFGEGVRSFDVEGVKTKNTNIVEKEIGWLVRTKGKESNEGGVATGFSVLDSVVLVD
jgi:glutathione synthase